MDPGAVPGAFTNNIYGGEIGSTCCNKSVFFTRHCTVVIGLFLIIANRNRKVSSARQLNRRREVKAAA